MLIDSHTHLDSFVRAGTLPAILERARAAGVEAMITIGTEPGDWEVYRQLAADHAGMVYHALGLHPCSVTEEWPAAVEALARALDGRPRAVAVGETGLDRLRLPKDPGEAARNFEWQQRAFAAHLALAAEHGLPVVVHSRDATQDCIRLIDEARFDWSRVVFHCWVDDASVLRQVNARGGRGSFTGIATYKNAEGVRQAALAQGMDRLMIETDAPYLTPEPHRKRPNEPALVIHTASTLARVFGLPLEEFAAQATRNTREFFNL